MCLAGKVGQRDEQESFVKRQVPQQPRPKSLGSVRNNRQDDLTAILSATYCLGCYSGITKGCPGRISYASVPIPGVNIQVVTFTVH